MCYFWGLIQDFMTSLHCQVERRNIGAPFKRSFQYIYIFRMFFFFRFIFDVIVVNNPVTLYWKSSFGWMYIAQETRENIYLWG